MVPLTPNMLQGEDDEKGSTRFTRNTVLGFRSHR